jgi:hypothetical protein
MEPIEETRFADFSLSRKGEMLPGRSKKNPAGSKTGGWVYNQPCWAIHNGNPIQDPIGAVRFHIYAPKLTDARWHYMIAEGKIMSRAACSCFRRSSFGVGLMLLTLASNLAAQNRPGEKQEFDVCDGTYALCTSAKCTSSLSCICEVKYNGDQPNYSVGSHKKGTDACAGIKRVLPAVDKQIPSRYYPITSYATCTNNRPWAMCLNMPCRIVKEKVNGVDTLVAKCACEPPPKELPMTPYVAVPPAGTFPQADACTAGTLSSATVVDVSAITLWLMKNSKQITPVNPAQVWVVPQ